MCDKVGLVEFKRLQTYFKSNKATKSKSPHTDWQGSMGSEAAEEDQHTRYRDTEGYEVIKSRAANKASPLLGPSPGLKLLVLSHLRHVIIVS